MAARIELSTSASKKISSLFLQKALSEEAGLRITVQGGGCSGLSYHLSIDDETSKFDRVFDCLGVRVIVDKKNPCFGCFCSDHATSSITRRLTSERRILNEMQTEARGEFATHISPAHFSPFCVRAPNTRSPG